MSLLSLLIALMAEKSLSSSAWRFDYYYQKYVDFFKNNAILSKLSNDNLRYALFLFVPVAIVYSVLALVEHGFLHLIISTLILIITIGCSVTKNSYKAYLLAAFKGEETTSALHHQQLLQDKNLPEMGFGQALIWLNYRYYIAIMLFFIFFGATGAVFYRLLTSVIEQKNSTALNANKVEETTKESAEETTEQTNDTHNSCNASANASPENTINEDMLNKNMADEGILDENAAKTSTLDGDAIDEDILINENLNEDNMNIPSTDGSHYQKVLFYIDWLPVRITSFGYMFVGHFSKALPTWMENLFDVKKPAHKVLIDVAEKSEDIMLEDEDCTAEPCLLVRLAKRNLLLMLAFIAILTLIGVVN